MWFILFRYGQFRYITIGNGSVYVLEKKFMVSRFYAQDLVEVIGLKIFNMGTVRAETILVDDELEMGMVLTQFAEKTSYGITLTIHFCLAVLFSDGFRGQNNHFLVIRMGNGSADRLQIIGNFAGLFISFFQASVGMARIRGKITGAVKVQQIAAFHKDKFFQNLASLQLPEGIFEEWPEVIGIDPIEDFPYGCVAGYAAQPIYRHKIVGAYESSFIKGE